MEKKRFLVIMLIVVLILGPLYICIINAPKKYTLTIKESSWSGWTENYTPEETTKEYSIVLGKHYTTTDKNLSFTVKRVGLKSITIETTEPFSDTEKGIDLKSNKKTFTIKLNNEVKLTTPTMDAGYIYYLTLND